VRKYVWLACVWSLSCAGARPNLDANVAPSASPPVAQEGSAAGSPLRLAPGEVAELEMDPDGSAGLRLATPVGDERFVLILASTRFDVAPPAGYAISLGAAERVARAELRNDCALGADAWRNVPLVVQPPPTGEGPRPSSTRQLLVMTDSGASPIDSVVVTVGPHATVIADTTHPSNLDASFAEQFRSDFENVILPRSRQVFGTEPDIDHDGRIGLVFSRLTKDHGVAFFSACDLLGSMEGCPGGNRGEYLYLTPPDAIDPPYNTPNAIKEILTHELAHLLHFNRKVLANGAGAWADTVYASEGIGALAQDVIGFQAGNLYVAKAGLDGIDDFTLTDVLDRRQRRGAQQGVLRGGAYLFFRYLYDRAGGDEALGNDITSRGGPALIRALLDAKEPVASALPRVSGASAADLGLDFYTALALSNRDDAGLAPPANACFSYLPTTKDPVTAKQRGTNLFAAFHGQRMSGPKVTPASQADGKLRLGGVEYLSLDAAPGQAETALHVRVDPAAAPRLRVARWK
jgi:hypothetical protein